jgi:phosphoribosylformimino-5-aminoimidazole carboxamide ribotide isomerase
MRVIGVIDLLNGRAVQARAGERDRYAPVGAVADHPIEGGGALAVARVYIDDLAIAELYIADLDAIVRHAPQWPLVASLATLGVPIWLDAGVGNADDVGQALDNGATHAVVGTETLASYGELVEIWRAFAPDRVALSLDLRNGQPLARSQELGDLGVRAIAARAADAGVTNLIVIDLARVGVGGGPDLELIEDVRHTAPGATLLAGGGVRSVDDVRRLADAGCDGVLVATALQNGRITAADIASIHRLRRHSSESR